MKICIISPTVLPILGRNQKYGGIELVIAFAAEELTKRGHDVTVFASGDSRIAANLVPTSKEAHGQGVSFEEEKKSNKLAYEMAVAKRPDVIWDHTLAVHSQEIREDKSIFLFRADIEVDSKEIVDTGSIPVVHTLHGPAKDHMPVIVKPLSDAGHYFVSISHDQGRRFSPYINKSQYLGTVYNAIDANQYSVNPNKKGNYLLWIGRFGMEKGTHIALGVAHRLRMPLKMVGKFSEKHEKAYFEKFIRNRLHDGDEVLENVTAEEKVTLFRDAFATVMSNLWAEPFGMVAIESMAAGTPVLGPALGSLVEVVNGAGVLVPVDDLNLDENDQEITPSQLKYMDRMAEYAQKLDHYTSELTRDRVEKIFSVKNNVDGYEKSFMKAIELKKETVKELKKKRIWER